MNRIKDNFDELKLMKEKIAEPLTQLNDNTSLSNKDIVFKKRMKRNSK